MKKDKILTIIIIIVGILILGESYNIIKSLSIKNEVTKDIKTIDVFKEKDKSLAIMVQNEGENDFGWHEAEDRSKWPDKAKYTYVGTECTNSEGVKIPTTNVLTFDETTYTAHIKTKQTIYCTLYFAKGRPPMEVLKAKGGNYFAGGGGHTAAVFGLYRFKGTHLQVTNNYICLGTQNVDTCVNSDTNKDKYLYRIIGITDNSSTNSKLGLSEGQLKVIKYWPNEGKSVKLCSSCSYFYWESSYNNLKTILNGSFLTGLDEKLQELISLVHWCAGSTSSGSGSESCGNLTSESKVGLMYQSDYYNSYVYSSSTYYDQNKTSWMYLPRNWNKVGVADTHSEWTMSVYDNSAVVVTSTQTLGGRSYGMLTSWDDMSSQTGYYRPVFYLTSEIGLVGEGTETNPYIITSKANA